MIVYQTENFGKRYEYRSNTHKNWVVPPHIHEFSEIAFTKKGVTTVILDGIKHLVPENHLIFILPNQIHEYSDETASELRCAVFSNDHIPAFFEYLRDRAPKDPVIDLTEAPFLLEEIDNADPSDTVRLCGILHLICDKIIKSSEPVPRKTAENSMLYEVIKYISGNFREDISLKDMAKRLGYHEKYLSSALHSLTNMNFRAFLSYYRIDLSKRLLTDGRERRISDIAFESGFSSINSFNRVFKETVGMTPMQYRARCL